LTDPPIVAGLIAAAVGGVSLARAGGTNHGRTIRLTEVDSGGKFISISHTQNGAAGDEFIFSANLRQHGRHDHRLRAAACQRAHRQHRSHRYHRRHRHLQGSVR
jgi:hypothetical protein